MWFFCFVAGTEGFVPYRIFLKMFVGGRTAAESGAWALYVVWHTAVSTRGVEAGGWLGRKFTDTL